MTLNRDVAYRGEDQRYHDRHEARTLGRARAMAAFIGVDETLLDVGCNRGITSRVLLRAEASLRVTGMELNRQTVDARLFSNDRFKFIEGNICDVSLPQEYDTIVYGAVHHHIVRERGLSEALRVWRMLAAGCRRQLFFETGHMTEGSRWAWQRALRRYFRTDEEHLHYLLRAIEDRLRGFKVIGRYRIHGVRRWLIRVELGEPTMPRMMRLDFPTPEHLAELRPLVRSFGSRQQVLTAATDSEPSSPSRFYVVRSTDGSLFVKQAVHAPMALAKEYWIGHRLDVRWAVRPLGHVGDDMLVFPLVDGRRLSEDPPESTSVRRLVANQLIDIWRDCMRLPSGCPAGPLLENAERRRLMDVIDLNPNNVLLTTPGGSPYLRVVDLEPQSTHYAWRNRLHIAGMLWRLRFRRPRAVMMAAIGFAQALGWSIVYQFRPIEQRLRDRQPAIAALVLVEARSWFDRLVVRLLPALDEL